MRRLFISSLALLISACGGGANSGNDNTDTQDDKQTQNCTAVAADVNWNALLNGNASKLSEYRLFQNPCNPTSEPNARGLAYDLSVPLFTDYASKYRFVFVPPGKKAQYDATEAFEFPVGSVLSKTFSLPSDTEDRGFDKENLIETRLLIKRDSGWVALPYVWNADKTDAVLTTSGTSVSSVIEHQDQSYSFNYGVPTFAQCTTCHQYNPGGNKDYQTDEEGRHLDAQQRYIKTGVNDNWFVVNANGDFIFDENNQKISSKPVEKESAYFSPIGPKARYLNSDFDYGSGAENQLQKWISEGLLSAIDDTSIDSTPTFHDDVSVDSLTLQQLDDNAKAWLDINCAHCHRLEGTASNTAFKSDFWSSTHTYDGTCREAVSGADGAISTIMIPGDAVNSLVFHRLNTTEAGDLMPPLGRALIHQEGTALIRRWLDTQTGGCP